MGDIGGTNEGPKVTQTKRETDERRERKKECQVGLAKKWEGYSWGAEEEKMAREESCAQKSIPA